MDTIQGFIWSEATVLIISGIDAERYLHNRLTQDIKLLKIHEAKYFAATTAQSKINCTGTIVKLKNNSYVAIVLSGNKNDILNSISQYKVADRVTFEHLLSARVTSVINNQSIRTKENKITIEKHANYSARAVTISEDELCIRLRSPFGYDLIELSPPFQEIEQISWDFFNQIRISKNIPLFTIDYDSNTLIMDTGLKNHVAFGKGCYIGQEVIEKIDARGKAPHRLQFFMCEDNENLIAPGLAVSALKDGLRRVSGKITSCAPSPNNSKEKMIISFIKNEDLLDYQCEGIKLLALDL